MTELEYLREFCKQCRNISESPIEGDTIERSAKALWDYVSTQAGMFRPWSRLDPWESESKDSGGT